MTPTPSPNTTSGTIPAYRSIAWRLPLFFILTLIGIAIIASTSVGSYISQRSRQLVQANLQTIATNEQGQVARTFESEISFLQNLTADFEIQGQVRLSNRQFEASVNPPEQVIPQLQTVWENALGRGNDPRTSPLVLSVLSNPVSLELNRRSFGTGNIGQDGFMVVNRYGVVVGANYMPANYVHTDSDWWQSITSEGQLYFVGRQLDRHAPTPDVTEIVLPIFDSGTGDLIGYIRGAFDFDYVKSILQQGRFGQSGRVSLMEETGQTVYTLAQGNSLQPYTPPVGVENTLTQFTSGADSYLLVSVPVRSRTAEINNLGWYVNAFQLEAEALAPVNEAVLPSILTASLFSLVAVLLLYGFYLQPLTADLGKLRGQALSLQENANTPALILGRDDELGVLADTFNQMTGRIRQELQGREQIIAQRTADLERRADQLEASMLVGRVASSSLDLPTLMLNTIQLIQQRTNYYHASIFLLDETGQYAVVRESTGEVGRILKARPHMLAVGSNSIVGQATKQREPFIARNVGEEFSYFNNPLLPETRSEVALPLIYQGDLLGALDVQSKRLDAFTSADLTVLQLMADQIAAAIFNARLFSATLERTQRQRRVIQLWKQLDNYRQTNEILRHLCQSLVTDFGYSGAYVAAVHEQTMTIAATAARETRHLIRVGLVRPVERGGIATALQQGTAVLIPSKQAHDPHSYDLDFMAVQSEVLAPIYIAQRITHVLSIYSHIAGKLEADDETLLELIAEAVGAALHNSQLYTAQERNLRELNQLYQQTRQSNSQATLLEKRFTDQPDAFPTADTAYSYSVPLLVRDQAVGEIVVETPRPWNAEEQTMVQTMAGQTAYALENSRLFAQTQIRLHEQEALFNLTNLLTSTLDVEEIYRRATQAFTEQMHVGRSTLATWEKPQGNLTVRAEYVLDEENPIQTGHYMRFEVRHVQDYPSAQQALATGQLTLRHSQTAELSPAERRLFQGTSYLYLLEVPLVVNQIALGVMSLFRYGRQAPFSEADLRLAQAMAAQTAAALQNAILATRARTQVTQLSSLNRLSRQLTLADTLRAIFETVRQEVFQLANATGIAISLLTPDNKVRWTYAYEYGAENDVSTIPPQEIHTGFTGHVLTTREPLLLTKFTNIEEMARTMRSITVGTMPNAWLGVPMFATDQLIGALVIENGDDPSAFGEADVQLLTTIASTVAIAISNVRQVEEIRAQRVEAEQLYTTGQQIGTAVASSEILAALAHSPLLPHAQALAMYVFAETPDQMVVYASWEAEAGQFGALTQSEEQLATADWPFLRRLTRETPLVYADVSTADLDATSRRLLRTAAIQSALLLPLVVGQTWVGALAIYANQPHAYTAATVRQLNSLATQVAATVQNRRLLRQTQAALAAQEQQSLQLQTAAEVAAAATASGLHELTTLFQTTVDVIRERFNLYYVGLFLLDEASKYTVLTAGTGAEGAEQIARNHKLPIGGNSLVGHTSVDGQPRIRQNVYQAADWLPNPSLPRTRSEIALALKVRDRNIGALTVQSAQPNSFTPELVRALQTMSDQIAIAIENANLLGQVQTNLGRANALYTASQQLIKAAQTADVFNILLDFARDSGLFQIAAISIPDPHSTQHGLMVQSWNLGDPSLFPLRFQMNPPRPEMLDAPYLLLPQASAGGLWGPQIQEWVNAKGIQAGGVVRLMANQRWVGTLGLGRATADPVTEADLQPFLALADQATVVLANQQLLRETQALYRLGRSLSEAITQEDVAQVTIDEIAHYTNVDQARVILFNKNEQQAQVVAAYGMVVDAHHVWPALPTDETAEQLTTIREPLALTDDGAATPSTAVATYLRPFGLKATLLIPAFSQNELMGVIALDSFTDERIFTSDNINFAQAAVDQFTTTVENIIFFDDALKRAQELIALNQISARISATLNVDELAAIVYGEISKIMPTPVFLLAEYDHRDQLAIPLVFALQAQPVDSDPQKIASQHPLYPALYAAEPLVLNQANALATAVFGLLGPAGANTAVPQSTIFVPMLQEGIPTGFLAVQSFAAHGYTFEQINLLRAISTQAVLGLSNARLFRETQENVAELRTLFNITQSIASSIDVQSRVERMVESLHTTLQGARVAVLLTHEDSPELSLLASEGYPQSHPLRYRANVGLPGKAIQYNTPMLMDDLRELGEALPTAETRSQLAIPLVMGQRIIGLLNAESDQLNAFSERDLRLLQTLSVSLAATIESGRLFTEIQNANEQLRELDKMKTQFLANMSHELRTPLNSIIGFSRLILKGIDGPISPLQEEDLTSIYNSGQHLLNLINDILDLAKIDAGKMALVFDRVDLNQLCQSVLSSAKGLVKSDEVELIWQIQPDLPMVEADPVRLRQVLLNLLSNAAKFTDFGSITLYVAQVDPVFVQIAVRDTGVGIAEKDFPRLFRAFEQVDSSDSRKVGGTGLGLPIVHELVQMHSGQVWLESVYGQGSTFFVRLPIRQPDTAAPTAELFPTAAAPAPNGTAAPTTPQPSILLVDDEPGVLSLYQRYLSRQPFELVSHSNGPAALEALRQRPHAFALVVLDDHMPGMNGWELLQAIRADETLAHLPVVVCTIEDGHSPHDYGATAILPKPIIADDLLRILDQLEQA